jgi:glycosyltransferase involved in cell wall biosynthesis
MRILQVSDSYPPATGGMERSVRQLSHELVARGHRVEVVTMSHPDAPSSRDGSTEDDGGVTVHRIDGWSRHLLRFSADPAHRFHPTAPDPGLVRRLRAIVTEFRPDIVHAHSWILHSCLEVALPPGCRLVVSLHDYGLVCAKKTMIHRDDTDNRCAGPGLRRCLPCAGAAYGPLKGVPLTAGLALGRRRLARVDAFLPVSEAVARACLPATGPDRVTVIPPFVPDSLVRRAGVVGARTPVPRRSEAGVPAAGVPVPRGPRPGFLPDGDFLLFAGAAGEHKGIGVLADAHRRMTHEAPLVVLGPGTPELVGTTGRPVITPGTVPHDQVTASFAAAAVAVVPSRWAEPFGLVAVEAMASATAVVVSNVGGLADIVVPGVTGLRVPPGDPVALAGALDGLLADPDLRARMGRAGQARAQRYTATAVVPRVIEAYERALRKERGG